MIYQSQRLDCLLILSYLLKINAHIQRLNSRLYNEEKVVAPDPVSLSFGCTCSREKCEMAIEQIGETEVLDIVAEQGGTFEMDCGFCGEVYKFNKDDVAAIFAE